MNRSKVARTVHMRVTDEELLGCYLYLKGLGEDITLPPSRAVKTFISHMLEDWIRSFEMEGGDATLQVNEILANVQQDNRGGPISVMDSTLEDLDIALDRMGDLDIAKAMGNSQYESHPDAPAGPIFFDPEETAGVDVDPYKAEAKDRSSDEHKMDVKEAPPPAEPPWAGSPSFEELVDISPKDVLLEEANSLPPEESRSLRLSIQIVYGRIDKKQWGTQLARNMVVKTIPLVENFLKKYENF